jgi:IS30 family transposase
MSLPTSGQPGRPRFLDEVKRRQVCLLVSAGCGIQEAARLLGCAASTIRREMKRVPEFGEEVRSAECNAQLDSLAAMRKAASTHWRAAAWLLERTNPRFARYQSRGYKPEEVWLVVEEVILTATEEMTDFQQRQILCRRMLAAAHRSTRAVESARMDKIDGLRQKRLHQSREDPAIAELLAELDHNRIEACKFLMNKTPKPNFINRGR